MADASRPLLVQLTMQSSILREREQLEEAPWRLGATRNQFQKCDVLKQSDRIF